MTTQTVQFRVYRYNPDKDAKPYMQDISVEIDATDRKLLDALVKLKIKDDSMSFRRSCREGVCGSDAMNINGKNGLACLTDIKDLKQTSASSVPAALPPARRSGGTRTNSLARPACWRRTASLRIPATPPPTSVWTTWKTRTACSVATPS